MNCWPSGKYVHLLYMYSILSRGSFCFNSAWHGGDQFEFGVQMTLHPNHHRLWKLNTGLQATCANELLHPSSGLYDLGFQMKYKTCSHLKRDFGPLGNSPVLLLLSPGKTPLTTTVAKFLDTSVCGALECLDPSLNPIPCEVHPILHGQGETALGHFGAV